MSDDLGYAAAVVLAAVLLRAAAAKLARPREAAGSFRALGLPAPSALSRAVPVAELALAVALLGAPRAGGAGALLLLAAFTAVLARAVRAGATTPCACFGASTTEPVSAVEIVRNGLLALLAVAALAAPRPVVPELRAALATAVAVAAGGAGLTLLRRRRRHRG